MSATVPVEEGSTGGVKRLIWLYFWLLIFEGALRKWILPQYAGPLLVVRDPVLILCYLLAWRHGLFPFNGYTVSLIVLAALVIGTSLELLIAGATRATIPVILYGARASFFHLPLIFLMAKVFRRHDVIAIGRALLWLAPLMGLIVLLQYVASPLDWINAGAGGSGEGPGQISVAAGGFDKIRPPGLFSYNTGLTSYLSVVAAFVVHGFYRPPIFSKPVLIVSSFFLAAMTVLAVSRSTAIAVSLVLAAGVLCGIVRPSLAGKGFKIAASAVAVMLIASSVTVLKEATSVLDTRFEEGEGLKVGILDRWLGEFTEPLSLIFTTPVTGLGLGLGTNAAAQLLTGERAFLLAEGEWGRVILEMGGLLGGAYIGWRLAVTVYLAKVAVSRLLALSDPLAVLLLAASGLALVNGNFAQPTSLGFAVFGAGLCLAAAQRDEEEVPEVGEAGAPAVPGRRGRGLLAAPLHPSTEHA